MTTSILVRSGICYLITVPEKPTSNIICDGCNVRQPWEHRCHKHNIVVHGDFTDKDCSCELCYNYALNLAIGEALKNGMFDREEDQEYIRYGLPTEAISKWRMNFDNGKFSIPLVAQDGIYSIDLPETERVTQLKTISGNWVEAYGNTIPDCELENPICEYRTVVRLKA